MNYKICWYITEKCHLACPFCYAFKSDSHPSFEELQSIGDLLAMQGVSRVNLAGGEPLLNKNIYKIIDNFFNTMKLSITTSLDLDNIDNLLSRADKLNRICVSLDTTDLQNSKLLRGKNYKLSNVLRNLEKLNQYVDIEINTVVSNKNMEDISNIGSFLSGFNSNIKWKLFQLTINENNIDINDGWNISDRCFNKIYSKVTKSYKKINIIKYSQNYLNSNYLIIRPFGDVCLPTINSYRPIGNVQNETIRNLILSHTLQRIA